MLPTRACWFIWNNGKNPYENLLNNAFSSRHSLRIPTIPSKVPPNARSNLLEIPTTTHATHFPHLCEMVVCASGITHGENAEPWCSSTEKKTDKIQKNCSPFETKEITNCIQAGGDTTILSRQDLQTCVEMSMLRHWLRQGQFNIVRSSAHIGG
jgi:hypothetical protein